MAVMVEQSDNEAIVTLQENQGIEQAAELKQRLQEAFAGAETVTLQLDNVSDMHPSCMQLMCAAHKTAEAEHKKVQVTGMSEKLHQAAVDSGFLRSVPCMHEPRSRCMWMGG
jgi:anti-anti-sigma factor